MNGCFCPVVIHGLRSINFLVFIMNIMNDHEDLLVGSKIFLTNLSGQALFSEKTVTRRSYLNMPELYVLPKFPPR